MRELSLVGSHGWYDFTVGHEGFEQRFAGGWRREGMALVILRFDGGCGGQRLVWTL